VKAEGNLPVTEAVYREKLSELARLINQRFGLMHPAANRPRLEPRSAGQ
jgi:hypothetical protein